jgi:hypothetical protein
VLIGYISSGIGDPREIHHVALAIVALTADAARLAWRPRASGARSHRRRRLPGLPIGRVALPGTGEDTGLNALDLVQPQRPRECAGAPERSTAANFRSPFGASVRRATIRARASRRP